jgi:hypothetical protein
VLEGDEDEAEGDENEELDATELAELRIFTITLLYTFYACC